MRIVYLLDWQIFYATELANAMSEHHDVLLIPRDHNFEISSPEEPMSLDEFLGRALSKRVRTDRLRYRRRDLRNVLEVLRVSRLIRAWKADVIHVQATLDWRVILLALIRRTSRLVVTVHDVVAHPGDRPACTEGFLNRLLLRSADKVVVHGEALRAELLRRSPGRSRRDVAVIPHGLYSVYRAWDDPTVREEPFTVLFFGRISPYKGLEDLIAAQPIVAAAVPQARFIIAGQGPFEQYRAAIRDGSRIEIHNKFISNREIPRLFRRAAVVVLPYREASQSGVIPIAYDFGKPVVVTNVGSLPEVVDHGSSGLLVEPAAPEQLASALIDVLTDMALRRRLSEGARRMGQTRLSWKEIAATTARVYGEG